MWNVFWGKKQNNYNYSLPSLRANTQCQYNSFRHIGALLTILAAQWQAKKIEKEKRFSQAFHGFLCGIFLYVSFPNGEQIDTNGKILHELIDWNRNNGSPVILWFVRELLVNMHCWQFHNIKRDIFTFSSFLSRNFYQGAGKRCCQAIRESNCREQKDVVTLPAWSSQNKPIENKSKRNKTIIP